MAARSQGRHYESTRQTTYRNSQYVYGSAVRQPARVPERPHVTNPERRTNEGRKTQALPRRQARKRNRLDIPFFMFLMSTIAICGIVLVNYVSVRSEITTYNEQITALKSTLNDMKLANDEEYSRIKNSVDLTSIKMKAIGKLGMTYAKEGQIIIYEEVDDDYVRQVSDIPKK